MQIRKALKKDIPQLSELFRQEIQYHQCMARHYELIPDFDWLAYTKTKLKQKGRVILVAEHGEGIAGFMDIRIIHYPSYNRNIPILQRILRYINQSISLPIQPMRWGFIEECYVIPSFRRQGIGRQLVFSAMEYFHSKQISRIDLSVVAKNKEREAFWRKLGFETFKLTLSREI